MAAPKQPRPKRVKPSKLTAAYAAGLARGDESRLMDNGDGSITVLNAGAKRPTKRRPRSR